MTSTALAALTLIGPPLPLTGPLSATAPALEVTVSAPPLITSAVTLPLAVIEIGAVPENNPLSAATLAVPLVAVRLITPLLVRMKSFTLRLRPAVSVTAAPATPPRPSTAAFTLMSLPALTVSAFPLCRLRIG